MLTEARDGMGAFAFTLYMTEIQIFSMKKVGHVGWQLKWHLSYHKIKAVYLFKAGQ